MQNSSRKARGPDWNAARVRLWGSLQYIISSV